MYVASTGLARFSPWKNKCQQKEVKLKSACQDCSISASWGASEDMGHSHQLACGRDMVNMVPYWVSRCYYQISLRYPVSFVLLSIIIASIDRSIDRVVPKGRSQCAKRFLFAVYSAWFRKSKWKTSSQHARMAHTSRSSIAEV